MSDQVDTFEFIEGQKACRDGYPCPEGASESFQRGYGVERDLDKIRQELNQ